MKLNNPEIFMVVRRSVGANYEWADVGTASGSHEGAVHKWDETTKKIPEWSKANPVVRVAHFKLVEEVPESKPSKPSKPHVRYVRYGGDFAGRHAEGAYNPVGAVHVTIDGKLDVWEVGEFETRASVTKAVRAALKAGTYPNGV